MALTRFSELWRDRVDESIAVDRDFAETVLSIMRRLNDPNALARPLDDVVSQPWGRQRRDWYDGAAQVEIGAELQVGLLVIALIEVGAPPGRDREQAGNQQKLDRLSSPYSAWCASGNDDGRLEWRHPIQISHEMDGGEPLVVVYPPSGVPLEIGHTEPETTVQHLARDGGVARWPYGHVLITLLLSTCTTGRPVQLDAPEVLIGGDTQGRAARLETLRSHSAES